ARTVTPRPSRETVAYEQPSAERPIRPERPPFPFRWNEVPSPPRTDEPRSTARGDRGRLRRRDPGEGPEGSDPELERRRRAALWVPGRRGDRAIRVVPGPARGRRRHTDPAGARSPRRADPPLRDGSPPQGWPSRPGLADGLS